MTGRLVFLNTTYSFQIWSHFKIKVLYFKCIPHIFLLWPAQIMMSLRFRFLICILSLSFYTCTELPTCHPAYSAPAYPPTHWHTAVAAEPPGAAPPAATPDRMMPPPAPRGRSEELAQFVAAPAALPAPRQTIVVGRPAIHQAGFIVIFV